MLYYYVYWLIVCLLLYPRIFPSASIHTVFQAVNVFYIISFIYHSVSLSMLHLTFTIYKFYWPILHYSSLVTHLRYKDAHWQALSTINPTINTCRFWHLIQLQSSPYIIDASRRRQLVHTPVSRSVHVKDTTTR